jgi:hypothetical protein
VSTARRSSVAASHSAAGPATGRSPNRAGDAACVSGSHDMSMSMHGLRLRVPGYCLFDCGQSMADTNASISCSFAGSSAMSSIEFVR